MSGPVRAWARRRDKLRDRPAADFVYRIVVGIVGVAVVIVGGIVIPLPGPGWAIVFVGLGILATEFDWARRMLTYTRGRYDAVIAWFKAQGLWVLIVGFVFTAATVVVTLWLLGALGWMGNLIGVESPWLQSPVGLGS